MTVRKILNVYERKGMKHMHIMCMRRTKKKIPPNNIQYCHLFMHNYSFELILLEFISKSFEMQFSTTNNESYHGHMSIKSVIET